MTHPCLFAVRTMFKLISMVVLGIALMPISVVAAKFLHATVGPVELYTSASAVVRGVMNLGKGR